jgi:hypothetical protein
MQTLLSFAITVLAQEQAPVQEWEQVEPVSQSYLAWIVQSLGPFYLLVLPLAGLVVFAGACLVVALSRRPSVIAAYLVFVPLPFLIGCWGSVTGIISSLQVIATAGTTPKPAELSAGISTALFTTLVGMALCWPSYLLVSVGLFLRTIAAGRRDTKSL